MDDPKISIIIPCYNHGQFLSAAIESVVSNIGDVPYEILIVNDGSSDRETIDVLTKIQRDGYRVLNQENKGLATSRNNAISLAKGKYILPLDADNKIHKNYLSKALDILETNGDLDIVYGDTMLFGDQVGVRKQGKFDFDYMINIGNHIDACAVYRKEVWVKNGGYEKEMPFMGHEDWEFWLNAYLNNFKFYYLEEICFYYRTSRFSMNVMVSTPGIEANRDFIFRKHARQLIKKISHEAQLCQSHLNYIKSYLAKHRIKSIIKVLIRKPI